MKLAALLCTAALLTASPARAEEHGTYTVRAQARAATYAAIGAVEARS